MPIRASEKSRYPEYWPQLSYAVRYLRAAGQCEWTHPATGERCPRMNGEPIAGNIHGRKTVLTVAHLDHCPEHDAMTNLLACCQAHHFFLDKEIHQEHARQTRLEKKNAKAC